MSRKGMKGKEGKDKALAKRRRSVAELGEEDEEGFGGYTGGYARLRHGEGLFARRLSLPGAPPPAATSGLTAAKRAVIAAAKPPLIAFSQGEEAFLDRHVQAWGVQAWDLAAHWLSADGIARVARSPLECEVSWRQKALAAAAAATGGSGGEVFGEEGGEGGEGGGYECEPREAPLSSLSWPSELSMPMPCAALLAAARAAQAAALAAAAARAAAGGGPAAAVGARGPERRSSTAAAQAAEERPRGPRVRGGGASRAHSCCCSRSAPNG
ncbi:hypothetical protein T492DRAFT_435799 [Pavlovales sp. CCMP2436]|nr:hypothetical protein T492DRAFT_435799 [Pavlovales sp. CCMP2436]